MHDVSNDDKSWGQHYWSVLWPLAEKFPDNPSDDDKKQFGTTVRGIVKTLPCEDCTKHSDEHIAKDAPENVTGKESALQYMCRFQNTANRNAGKPEVDCTPVVKTRMGQKPDCQSCKADATPTPEVQGTPMPQQTAPSISGSEALLRSKQAKRDLFYSYCDQANISRPEIRHEPCPGYPETSCMDYNDEKNITMYLNPFTDSDRQVLHEFEHYRTKKLRNRISTENQAQDFAYGEIKKVAPELVMGGRTGGSGTTANDWDTSDKADLRRMGIKQKEQDLDKLVADIDKISGRGGKRKRFSLEEEFPLYAMIRHEEDRKARDEEKKKLTEKHSLSMLDPLYESVRKAAGFETITAAQLNLAITPQIIQNLITTLLEANLTPAGSGLMTAGLGISMVLAGLVGRKTLSTNDQILIQDLGASFFWRSMEFLNPKRHFKDSLMEAVDEFKDGNYSPAVFLETPKSYDERMKKALQANAGTGDASTATVPGAVTVGSGSTVGTTTQTDPAQYQLDGDDYYEDSENQMTDEYGNPISTVPRNVYTGQIDAATIQQQLAAQTQATAASSQFAQEYEMDDGYSGYM